MAIPIIGDIINAVLNKGSDLVSEFITDKDKQAEFKHKLEMAVLADGSVAREVELKFFEAQQATIQAELAQSDLYTKQTRPRIARQSWYVSGAYAIGTFLSNAYLMLFEIDATPDKLAVLVDLVQFEWEIYLAMAAPALQYIGVRSLDIWRSGGAKRF